MADHEKSKVSFGSCKVQGRSGTPLPFYSHTIYDTLLSESDKERSRGPLALKCLGPEVHTSLPFTVHWLDPCPMTTPKWTPVEAGKCLAAHRPSVSTLSALVGNATIPVSEESWINYDSLDSSNRNWLELAETKKRKFIIRTLGILGVSSRIKWQKCN